MKIQLALEQRDAIFPANIVLGNDLRVVKVGPAISGRFPGLAPGEAILDHFRPRAASIQELSGKSMVLQLDAVHSEQTLSGWVIPFQSGYFLALRLSPANYSLENSGLQITDFAADDPAVHALLMFSIQRALLEEQRLVALELDRARQLSQDLGERLSRAAGFIAHDFNNFLSIIKLNCDRLKLELAGQEKALRLVDIINSAASRGSAITRSLMTLSRQRNESRFPVQIDSLIQESQSFFATTLGARISLELDLRAPGARALVSPAATLSCLVNLLINARDAMPQGGRVRLVTRLLDVEPADGKTDGLASIVIEVADNGIGMSEEACKRAFEPLYSTKINGNGLGLASVQEFVDEAGGEVAIVSAPGKGTCVSLSLPCIDRLEMQQSVSTAMPQNEEQLEARPETLTAAVPQVLVVEDEPFALEALCELLDAAGFAVCGVTNIAEALDELQRSPVKVLLSDIVLSDESGAHLARVARNLHPSLRIILMSGYVPQDEILEDDWMFLRKPIDARLVTELLRDAIGEGTAQI